MNIFASKIYRIVVPKFRTKILENYLPKAILKYYDKFTQKPSEEIVEEVLNYFAQQNTCSFSVRASRRIFGDKY